MKIVTRIVAAIVSVIFVVLAIPFTIIALIIDMVNSVIDEKLTIDTTTEMWRKWHHVLEMTYNGEI